jgi:putative ABC transport system permease protein
LGGGLGLLFAYKGIDIMRASLSFDAFKEVGLKVDSNVVMFATVVSIACALLCALAPALRASRTDVTSSLKDESRTATAGRSHSRLRTVLVTGEISFALFLLIGTGLLFVSIFRIQHQNLGFQTENLLTAGITLDDARYKDAEHREAFVRELLPQLQQMPGAEFAAVTSDLPASGAASVTIRIQGQPDLPAGQVLTALDTVVTPDYFRTAGISILQGRPFSEQDTTTAPRVLVVNQKFVDRYLQGEDAVGKHVQLEVSGAPAGWSQIIGVVHNLKTYSQTAAEDPAVYEPFHQRPIGSFSLMVRTKADPDNLASDVRTVASKIDAELPLALLSSMRVVIDQQSVGDAFFSRALGSFALMALALAAIGIYGLIAYNVGQRTHEIGIRMAMGARSQDVLRMIVREGMMMTVIGAAIGLAISLPLPRIFSSIFFNLNASEPRLYFVVPITIVAVAILATYIPARRAARVDPMNALRQE